MLASLGVSGLRLCGEGSFGVLQVGIGADGSDAVRHLSGAGDVEPAGLDAQHVHTHSGEQSVLRVVQTEIQLGSAAVLDVVGRICCASAHSALRACRNILHLPYCGSAQREGLCELPVHAYQRRAAEGVERRAAVEREHVGHIGGEGMPGLAELERNLVLCDGGISLTEPEGGSSGGSAETRIEVSLNLGAHLPALVLVSEHIKAET